MKVQTFPLHLLMEKELKWQLQELGAVVQLVEQGQLLFLLMVVSKKKEGLNQHLVKDKRISNNH